MAAEIGMPTKSQVNPIDQNPITRDFLGGSFENESKELDLDLHVPSGWEKRLDLKSGKIYIQKCIQRSNHNPQTPTIQTRPNSKNHNLKPTLNLFDDTSLSLSPLPKLPSKVLGNYNAATYQSVCTLDKVKSALDRARKRPSSPAKTPFSDESRSSSVRFGSGDLVAGACPRCLLYVLMSESNLKCPKCNSAVTLPVVMSKKKPKIDLNMSI